ncbi:MAG: reductase [Microcella sp.]|uniref:NAD-dependent epimerase/dehydratase family protein n=1 Tax=Microcella sp. TaxID=1913979 RepID=UPI0024CA87EB|nr:NAD-dependent epimerase/dehydratase family protein [Microcella sp.]UYN84645.1 MAG: reductase [Microcella sp.]
MASILVLGGTAWLGREIATQGVAAGHDVTCVARGLSGDAAPGTRFVQADRAVPGALEKIAAREWDHVIELAWDPPVVSTTLDVLADRAAHWTLVSSISVYDGDTGPGADELQPLLAPDSDGDYGTQKSHAETLSAAALGERLLTVRPGLIVGRGDSSDRFGYWPARFALAAVDGRPVLAPPTADAWVQCIEAVDLAAFTLHAATDARTGPVDATGLPVLLAEVLDACATAAGFDGERRTADADWLVEHDVQYWAGPRSLPLWLPAEMTGFAQRDTARFRSWGGATRPLAETAARVLADELERGLERERRSGLTRADELALLNASP